MQNRFWYLLSKKLTGVATDAELDELEHLLTEYPEWQDATNQITNYWECPYEPGFTEESYTNHIKRMERLGHDTSLFSAEREQETETPIIMVFRKRNYWLLGGVAASIIGLLLLTSVFVKNNNPATPAGNPGTTNEVVTNKGKKTKIVLPDGSQVWLNADSKLEYKSSFGKSDRDIALNGEAYFDVVKNEALPFIIQTKKIRIKVTGTAFNVKAYSEDLLSETSLIRGKVEVTINARPDEKYILKPNEKIVVRDDEDLALGSAKTSVSNTDKRQQHLPLIQLGYLNHLDNDSLAIETSWMYNRLIFEDESFEDIARKMERWYGVSITIADSKVAAYRFTYQIKDETIAKALTNIQYAARFHFTINNDIITITK